MESVFSELEGSRFSFVVIRTRRKGPCTTTSSDRQFEQRPEGEWECELIGMTIRNRTEF